MWNRLDAWIRGPRTWWRITLVITVPLVVVGAVLTPVLAVGNNAPREAGRGVRSALAASSDGSSSTTDTSAPSTTSTTVETSPGPAASTSTPQPPSSTTTTVPACTDSQFVVTVTTDQRTYRVGEVVNASAYWTNDGPTCQWTGQGPTSYTGPAYVSGSSAYFSAPCAGWYVDDAQGQPVWQSGATPTGAVAAGSCSTYAVPNPTPSDYSYPFTFAWHQDQCDYPPGVFGQPGTWDGTGNNPNCPDTQVSPGAYVVSIDWWDASPASAGITISS